MTDFRKLATDNLILRGVVGSTVHGTAIEGQDDRDEMGVCVEPPEYVCGLSRFEQYIERTQPEGVRSGPGDLDLCIYSLRKFCHLAAKGNPSIILLLWLPEYLVATTLGKELVELRQAFVSREAGWRYLGYLRSQRAALTGEKSTRTHRPEIVERYGFDSKFAMHAARLGFQGIEYLTQGIIDLPIREPTLGSLRDIRRGKLSLREVLALLADLERELREAAEQCTRQADYRKINEFLVEAHNYHWQAPRPARDG